MKMKVFMQAHGVWEAIEPKDAAGVVEDKTNKRALAIIYQGILEDLLRLDLQSRAAEGEDDAGRDGQVLLEEPAGSRPDPGTGRGLVGSNRDHGRHAVSSAQSAFRARRRA